MLPPHVRAVRILYGDTSLFLLIVSAAVQASQSQAHDATSKTRKIHKLDEAVVNRIAAGEVPRSFSDKLILLMICKDHSTSCQCAEGDDREQPGRQSNIHHRHRENRRTQAAPDPRQRHRHRGKHECVLLILFNTHFYASWLTWTLFASDSRQANWSSLRTSTPSARTASAARSASSVSVPFFQDGYRHWRVSAMLLMCQSQRGLRQRRAHTRRNTATASWCQSIQGSLPSQDRHLETRERSSRYFNFK